MVTELHVEGYEAYKKAEEENKDKKVFALFCGSKDSSGKSWCPDCVAAEPVVGRNLAHLPEDAVFIHCNVGDRPFWKDQKNPFRTDISLKLKAVPTLMCVGKPQKLVEEQLMEDGLIKMMFADD
ncbi:hypothetical protein ACJMK2_011036 [Sinanodonta woodiana]|uniref:Thioredoxin domain-containing protein 17 n=1 Tax=Sinanodonta woodiana TaxID=1069815 RepID=A0ABD3V3L5_SINWO